MGRLANRVSKLEGRHRDVCGMTDAALLAELDALLALAGRTSESNPATPSRTNDSLKDELLKLLV